MKNSVVFFFLLFLGAAALQAQSDCSLFYPFKAGVQLEYTYFDKKGKLESKTQSTIKRIKNLPSGNGVEAVVANIVFDKKDKEQFSGEYVVRCEGGVIGDGVHLTGAGQRCHALAITFAVDQLRDTVG